MTNKLLDIKPVPVVGVDPELKQYRDFTVVCRAQVLRGVKHREYISVSVPKDSLPPITRFHRPGEHVKRQPAVCYRSDQEGYDHYLFLAPFKSGEFYISGQLMANPPESAIPEWYWSRAFENEQRAWDLIENDLTHGSDDDYEIIGYDENDEYQNDLMRARDYRIRYTGFDEDVILSYSLIIPWASPVVWGSLNITTNSNEEVGVSARALWPENGEVHLIGLQDDVDITHGQGVRYRFCLEYHLLDDDDNPNTPFLGENPLEQVVREVALSHWNFGIIDNWGTLEAPFLGRQGRPPSVEGDQGILPVPTHMYDRRVWEGNKYSAAAGSQDSQGGHNALVATHNDLSHIETLMLAAEGLGILRLSNPREPDGSIIRYEKHKGLKTHREVPHSSGDDMLGFDPVPRVGPSGRNARDSQHCEREALHAYVAICGGLDRHAVEWVESQAELMAADAQMANKWPQNGRSHGRRGMDAITKATVVGSAKCSSLIDAAAITQFDLMVSGWEGAEVLAMGDPARRCLIVKQHTPGWFTPYEEGYAAQMCFALMHRLKDTGRDYDLAQWMAYLLSATVVLSTHYDEYDETWWLPYRLRYNDGIDPILDDPGNTDYLDFGGGPCHQIVEMLYKDVKPALISVGRNDDDLYLKAKRYLAWRDEHDPVNTLQESHQRTIRDWE